jgi:uncharacterized repeat protein (TIGR04138 family)
MTTSSMLQLRRKFHQDAAEFVFDALRHTQEVLGRVSRRDRDEAELSDFDDDQVHISGAELLEGIRLLGLQRYGLMARHVFASWGVTSTEDFGRIVFDLVEEGKMRKTEQDQLSDFYEIYNFAQALERDYRCSTHLPSLK